MTQREAARRGRGTAGMRPGGERDCIPAEVVQNEVARGRLVIPATLRHLAGSGGAAPAPVNGHTRSFPAVVGHPGARADAGYWVNQTVAQRWVAIADPE